MPDASNQGKPARLRLMGDFRLTAPDGRPIDVTSRRTRGLLAYLALSPDRGATRERLAGLLWSDRGETQARASLRQSLLVFRAGLAAAGLDILDIGRDAIALKAGTLDWDVAAIERAMAGGDPEALTLALDGIGAGRLLEDGEAGGLFGDWLDQTRARLDQALAAAAIASLQRLEADRNWARSRALADAYLRRDPLDEAVAAAAIRAEGAMGASPAAHRRYQALREALARELGVRPGAAVEAALKSLTRDQAPPAASAPLPAPAEARPEPAALALPARPSIAILAFANLTGDPDQDYFAEGMAEEIIAALSRFKSIFVIASGSSFSFRGKAVTPREAAASLGVRYVLEGAVRKGAGRVRISVRLIDAVDDAQIWADRFEDTLDDVFALQDRVALSVAGVIEPTIQGAEVRRAAARPTDNMTSYELFLRATPLAQTLGRTEVFGALDLLNRAIAMDPRYGQALSLAALCHSSIAAFDLSGDAEAHRGACRELVTRALAADGDNPEVLARCANALGGVEEALQGPLGLIERCVALNPGSAYAWFVSGRLRVLAGHPEIAIEHLETSMRLDPRSFFRRAHQLLCLGVARFAQGRFAEAAPLFRESLEMRTAPMVLTLLAACLGHLGQAAAAQDALARYRQLTDASLDGWSTQLRDPGHRRLFLEGLELAQNPRPYRLSAVC
jgi:adenylate cyclase